MTLNRVLALTSVALGALLVIQVALVNTQNFQPPPRRFHASWVNNANTLKEGADQSDHVILGEVIELRKGPDLVVVALPEPGGEDRIPTTIVKLAVMKTYKGAPGEVVELMQTGQSTDALLLPSDPAAAAGDDEDNDSHGKDRDKGKSKGKGKGRPKGQSNASPTFPSAGDSSRATILEDDPPYQVGEKYIVFLKDMQQSPESATALAAVSPGMTRALAPEGRYQLTKGDHLKPMTARRGFAPNWVGRPLTEFESEIAATQ